MTVGTFDVFPRREVGLTGSPLSLSISLLRTPVSGPLIFTLGRRRLLGGGGDHRAE